MRAYVDASVVLRIVLGEPTPLREWGRISQPIASELIRLECVRTIDKARVRLRIADTVIAERRAAVLEQLEAFEIVPLTPAVLDRAAEPFPTELGTLDAIHLATAVLTGAVRDELPFATHDRELALAARAIGLRVLGAGRA